MEKFDVLVIGLGAMGSAALYQLAKRGARVAGFDRFSPPHDQGSSHGDTRITRLAIGEGEHYTPLVKRSHEIWREIEKETGADLLTQCGELIISSRARTSSMHVEGFFDNTVGAARKHGVAHELLGANQIRARFPLFDVRDDETGYYEPEAGFVRPEACIAAELSLAERKGAAVHRNETVLRFEASESGVAVETDRGRYHADRIIVSAGAWLPKLLGGSFASLLKVYRQVLYWFAIDGDPSLYRPQLFPVFIWERPDWPHGIYGFPAIDNAGLKIATEYYAETASPESVTRSVPESEIASMCEKLAAPHIKGLGSRSTKAVVCLYTVTPDMGFIIDHAPQSERIILASCCSGHGFKHSAAIGEILADMAQSRPPAFNLAPFRLARFG
ncbi:MAG TPA: N-methyl-L-tryptophan oxidase [Rhizomicrobium sp.]|nr:N-methyl-L-tryptophan oxidase [Rhizomicrobium sp.]